MRVGKRTKQRQEFVPRHSYHSFTTVDKPAPEKRPRKRKALIADRRSDIATVKQYIEELKRTQTPHFSGGSNPIDFPKAL